jgi:hypothetical protein
MKINYLILALIVLVSCNSKNEIIREHIDLNGYWQFSLDTANVGIQQNWFLSGLKDSIKLPGTTDLNKKGFFNKDTTTMHLNRVFKYVGAAWYRKKIIIPESFRNKHTQLFLERTKPSMVWIDSTLIGSSRLLQSQQKFDLPDNLSPGVHFITIRIDNGLKNTPYGNVHIYSDDTQTNWNGMIGKLLIEATSKTYISNLQVYPDIDKKKIRIKLEIANWLNLKNVDIELIVKKTIDGKTQKLKSQRITTSVQPVIELEYLLGNECSLWDEYQTPTYTLTAVISNGKTKDSQTVPFGMRRFTAKGTQFDINGRTIFLRGKHEAAVFPLTGHPPMDVEGWLRVYKIAKSYGINHYRFHSYCPPEAAFTAADQVGIYIQAELPFWGGLDSDSVAEMLKQEGLAMLKAYANHPSFVMFSPGNEIWSGHDRVEKNIVAFKEFDNRLLYTMGSNNCGGFVPPRPCADYFVGARTPYKSDTILTHTRLSQCYVDSKEGGILNTQLPSTEIDFNYAVSNMKIPVVSHEMGQYQIYPDYGEIKKYTGVLRAWNLEVFRDRLIKSGMIDQNVDFQKASGAWSALCYKAEMEAAIRTKGLAGFQLLDLQDFPGQGTALVGILDAFMDSKNVISKDEWLQSCNDVVLLLEFPKYCWTTKEKFHAKAIVANYSNQSLNKELHWEIKNSSGNVIQKGSFPSITIRNGRITPVGEIEFDLSSIKKAEKLNVCLSLSGKAYTNLYPVWVYDATKKTTIPKDIVVSDVLNNEVLMKLQNGAKVLLFPKAKDVQDHSVSGLFPPEFWNYGMFKGISERTKKPVSPGTLGILTNPKHPLFNSFPTDFHTNWQWFSIIKASNSFILDGTSNGYKPIVQIIDNLERNHKLGLIFEFKVGKGKLLVCMSQLNQMTDKPEAVQLYQSIIKYMESNDFNPGYEIAHEALKSFFVRK